MIDVRAVRDAIQVLLTPHLPHADQWEAVITLDRELGPAFKHQQTIELYRQMGYPTR